MRHPLNKVEWINPETLRSNKYNPNHVAKPELKLLKTSILKSGWTQPIVVMQDGEIVDGFHRWNLGLSDKDVREISDGLVPVVRLSEGTTLDDQQDATIRHNRARGSHGIVKMGELIRSMRDRGRNDEEIAAELGMEREEIDRLTDYTPSPEKAGKDHFGKGWVPTRAKRP